MSEPAVAAEGSQASANADSSTAITRSTETTATLNTNIYSNGTESPTILTSSTPAPAAGDTPNAHSWSPSSNPSDIAPPASAPAPATTTFHQLFALPRELQRLIYSFALGKPNPIICVCSNSGLFLRPIEPHGPVVDINLFLASKAVYEEAKIEFLCSNTIRLNSVEVSSLNTSEGQRNTIRAARHLIVLFQPKRAIDDERVFNFEFPRFRHLETLYLIIYHSLEGFGSSPTDNLSVCSTSGWINLWVARHVTIEWRNTDTIDTQQTLKHLNEKRRFETHLRDMERSMVRGVLPEWKQAQQW